MSSETAIPAITEKFQYGQQVQFEIADVIQTIQTSKSRVQYVQTKRHGTLLIMDDEIQYSTLDEHRYHDMLVEPVFDGFGKYKSVLILGGGDGLAARTLYAWTGDPEIESVTIVDWDREFVEFAKTLAENQGSLEDPRTTLVYADALEFVRTTTPQKRYDSVIIDLPDPDTPDMQELYLNILRELPKICKRNAIVISHVGPTSLDDEHPAWDFIKRFRDLLMKTFEMVEVTLNATYIPSFSHEWGIMTAYTDSARPSTTLITPRDIAYLYDAL